MNRRETRKPAAIGDERYLLEMIDTDDVETAARKQGWTGDDGIMDYCEPNDVACYSVFKSLDKATEAARNYLKGGSSFWGHVYIDHQRFEVEFRKCPPEWVRQKSYEVARDGECIEVSP